MEFQTMKTLTTSKIQPHAPSVFLPYLVTLLCVSPFVVLSFGAVLLFTGILSAVFEIYILNYITKDERGFIAYFHLYDFKLFRLCVLRRIIVLAFSVLLVIPGIIKALEFSLAVYLFQQDKQRSSIEILEQSRKMMKGHRRELILIYFGAAGAILLTLLTFGILSIWTLPYIKGLKANFYLQISAQLDSNNNERVTEITQ